MKIIIVYGKIQAMWLDNVASGKTRNAKAMKSMTKRQENVGGLMGEWNTLAKCRKQRFFISTHCERAKIILIHMVALFIKSIR